MNNLIISQKSVQYKSDLNSLLILLENFATKINNQQLQVTTNNLRIKINEPLLFVVLGEIKSGKSSFVNDLLQANICKTTAAPCTEIMQEIVYSNEKFEKPVNQYLHKIGLTHEILKTVSIIDTPGSNIVVKNYQPITQEFIRNSDLIFLVFLAKNPYNRSTWELLDYFNNECRKKLVFILQQADLTNPEELVKNKENLAELASSKGIKSPIIFATELEYEVNSNENGSGVEEVRNHIKQQTWENTGIKKLQIQEVAYQTEQIIDLLKKDLRSLEQQLTADQLVVKTIKYKLQQQQIQSDSEFKSLIDKLLIKYDNIIDQIKSDFRKKLSFLTLVKISYNDIFQNKSVQPWIKELRQNGENQLKLSLGEIVQDGMNNFVNNIRNLLQGLIDDCHQMRTNQIHTNLIAVDNIESRQEIIEDAQQKISTLLDDRAFLNSVESVNANVAPKLLGGNAALVRRRCDRCFNRNHIIRYYWCCFCRNRDFSGRRSLSSEKTPNNQRI